MTALPAVTVSELTAALKVLVEESFPDVSVIGEISNLVRARSGHVYLTLKDEGAALSAVIWRGQAERLRFEPEEGMEVVAGGRLNLYPPRGQYQLAIRTLAPRGVGSLMAAYEKLRARLASEGLFDEERKRPIPFLPAVVGVVTSPTGAAVRDILKVLRRRCPGVNVLLSPSRVQGDGASLEIAAAVRRLDEHGVDVLIVGRGGGSIEDLWAFNEEPVARAIAACRAPVISAVGHETDVTIADFVADLRAPTPSAAAERAVPSEADLRATLGSARARVVRAGERIVLLRRERLGAITRAYGFRLLPDRLREHAQHLDEIAARAGRSVREALVRARETVTALAGRAEALSPVRVLARGYSVTSTPDGTPIRSATQVVAGDRILTRLESGRISSRVEETG